MKTTDGSNEGSQCMFHGAIRNIIAKLPLLPFLSGPLLFGAIHYDNTSNITIKSSKSFSPAWSIHRHACTEPTCGFHCDKGIGCFTYNTTLNQEFRLTVTCWDAYDTDVTAEIVIHLDYNKAPRFNNLPSKQPIILYAIVSSL